jgi:outer membrane protein OmpA-like peptidoglycan-associated protein
MKKAERYSFILLLVTFLIIHDIAKAQSTYGQARLKCRECLLIQVLNQANTAFKQGKYDDAIPYYNLYLNKSGDNSPKAIENLAESYWKSKMYDSSANWFNKVESPKSKERLGQIAVIKAEEQKERNLKFFMRENMAAAEKPADKLVAKKDENYTISMSCAQQYRIEVCGANIIINTELPKEEEPITVPEPKEIKTANNKSVASPHYIIHFDFDKYQILSSSYRTLDSVVHDLESDPSLGVVLVGHTDLMGSELYNEKLAVNRADMAETYLMSVGMISKNRIIAKAFGKRIPVLPLQKPIWENRRVEIYFIKYSE